MLMWSRAVGIIKEKPLIGHGMGTYLIETRRLGGTAFSPPPIDNAGNFYLQMWAETGLLGMVFFIWLVISTIVRSIHQTISDFQAFRVSVLCAFVGLAGSLFFGSHLLFFEINLLFWFLVFLIWEGHDISGVVSGS